MQPRRLSGALLLALACLHSPQAASAMSLADVVQRVLAQHPDIALARLAPELAEAETLGVEGQLDPVVTLKVGLSDETTPKISDFASTGTRIYSLQGGVRKPLASGGEVSLGLDYSRTLLAGSPLFESFLTLNPTYRNQISIRYRHPLLKGAGRPAYNKGLAAAKAGEEEASMRQYVTDEQLALKAVRQYFALAANQANLKLATEAVERARRLLAYQKTLESFGLIEEADRLQAEALVATREMERRKAEVALAQTRTDLNRLMLRDIEAPIDLELDAMPTKPLESLDAALSIARSRRPQLASLDAALKAAEAKLSAALDQQRMQLDVVAELGSRAVTATPGAAVRQGLSINNRFAFIGMEFSGALPNRAAQAAVRKAELERQRLLLMRQQAIERIKDELAAALTNLRMRRQTYDAARARAAAEKRKFEAEMNRYRQGRSDTATVVQFENDLRTAEIQVTLEEFLLRLAQREFAWAKGTLLDELGLEPRELAP